MRIPNQPTTPHHHHSLQFFKPCCVSNIIKPTYDYFILVISMVFIIITIINLYVCGIINSNTATANSNTPLFEYTTDNGILKLRHDDGFERSYKLPSVEQWKNIEQSDIFKKGGGLQQQQQQQQHNKRHDVYPIHVNQAILDSMIPHLTLSSSSSSISSLPLTPPKIIPVIVLLCPERKNGDDDDDDNASSAMIHLWQTLYPWVTLWVVGINHSENNNNTTSTTSSSRNIRYLKADVTSTDGIQIIIDALRDDHVSPTIIVDGASATTTTTTTKESSSSLRQEHNNNNNERLKKLFNFVNPGGLYIVENDNNVIDDDDDDASTTPLADDTAVAVVTQLSLLTQSEFISATNRHSAADAVLDSFEDGRWVGEIAVSPNNRGFIVRKKTTYERQFAERAYRFAHNLKVDVSEYYAAGYNLNGHFEDDMYYIMAMDPGV